MLNAHNGNTCQQESEKGHWHIPIASELDYDAERTWLCITRANSHLVKEASAIITKGNTKFTLSLVLHLKYMDLLFSQP